MVVDEDDEVMPAGSLALQAFDAIGAPACVARARLARMFRGSSLDRARTSLPRHLETPWGAASG